MDPDSFQGSALMTWEGIRCSLPGRRPRGRSVFDEFLLVYGALDQVDDVGEGDGEGRKQREDNVILPLRFELQILERALDQLELVESRVRAEIDLAVQLLVLLVDQVVLTEH